MKQFLFAIGLLTILIPRNVQAAGAGDAATLSMQSIQLAELIPINISDALTSLSTELLANKNVILDPIANGIINSMLQQATDDIIAWANGGFEGEPLIISNPGQYIQNKGLAQAKIGLSFLPQNTFGDSAFEAIASEYIFKTKSLKERLEEINKSAIPGIIQQNICDEDALSSLVMEEVRDDSGNYNESEFLARKQEIYEYACEGDPNEDKDLAERLEELGEQRPEIGLWEKWLATTGGNNEETKTELSRIEIEAEVKKNEELAFKELFEGLGPISQKTCIEELEANEGEDPSCLAEAIVTPADVVSSAVSNAFTSGLDRLENIMGEGSLTNLLTTLATQYVVSGLSKEFGSSGGGGSTVRPPRQDLVDDPSKKEELTATIFKQMDNYGESLTTLEGIDSDYARDIQPYRTSVEAGYACYSNLVEQGSISEGDNRYQLFKDRKTKVDAALSRIENDLIKIAEARNLLTQTKQLINESNSSQEISQIFQNYTKAVSANNYPTSQTISTRKSEYNTNKNNAERDKDVKTYLSQCQTTSGSGSAPDVP